MTQTKMSDLWKKKANLINDFYARAENRKRTEFRSTDRDHCQWCVKFQELSFNGCLNCGRVFKNEHK